MQTQNAPSNGLNALWKLIGENGSQLDPPGKMFFITALSTWGALVDWSEPSDASLWDILLDMMSETIEQGNLPEFPETTPPLINEEALTRQDALLAIKLTEAECWSAVALIAREQLNQMAAGHPKSRIDESLLLPKESNVFQQKHPNIKPEDIGEKYTGKPKSIDELSW